MRIFFYIPLVLFIIVILVMMAKLNNGDKKSSVLIGHTLPAFNLPGIDKNSTTPFNSKDITGQFALINIFGSWCASCKIEHKFLVKLNKNKVLPIYGIAWRDKKENLLEYLKEHGNPYKQIGADLDGKTIIEFGVTGAPESFLIGPNGKILYHHLGPLSQSVWDSEISPLMQD